MLMRLVRERGAGNLRTVAQAEAVGAEWGFSHQYVLQAAKVAAWSPELAARVVAREYPLTQAIGDERTHRLGPWHVRHAGTPHPVLPPLPGPDATEEDLQAAVLAARE